MNHTYNAKERKKPETIKKLLKRIMKSGKQTETQLGLAQPKLIMWLSGWVGGWKKWKCNQSQPPTGWVGAWNELGNIP